MIIIMLDMILVSLNIYLQVINVAVLGVGYCVCGAKVRFPSK